MKGIDLVSAIDASMPRMAEQLPGVPVQVIGLMRLMRAANHSLSTYLEPLMRSLAVSESSLHTLLLLLCSEDGIASPGVLCDLVGQTRANMTRILDALLAKEYISRSTDGGDGRRRVIRITAEGKRFVRTALPALGRPMTLAVAGLKQSQIKQIDELLRLFVVSLEAGGRRMRADR